ncbi:MAG TPA: condensation domain-containing protein, partial [Blastocatellia bacterium]
MSPESPAYNVAVAVRIVSEIDVSGLKKAFQALVDRHPMLRTTFASRQHNPVQTVHGQMDVYFEHVNAGTLSESELYDYLAREARRPFDLEQGPLFRAYLFEHSLAGRVLLLTAHHIVSDFWSLAVALRELGSLYSATQPGDPAPGDGLSPLPIQYTDYVRWQRETLEEITGERLWSFWQKECGGELPLLDLPIDRPRPAFQTYNGASLSFELPVSLTEAVKDLGRRYEATVFMTLLAAFNVLLHRYTGQDDILVGSPTAGRSRAEMEGLIGYFVNPVVVRSDLSGGPRFNELLQRVRRRVLRVLEHQGYPFPLLIERLHPDHDSSRTPLFQVMFILQKAPLSQEHGLAALAANHSGEQIALGDLQLESVVLDQRIAQFDMTLVIAETEQGLLASFEYNTDLFDETTIARMAEHYRQLLESIVADPYAKIAELPMMRDEERTRLLVEWNRTEAPYAAAKCIHDLFRDQVRLQPDAMALVCGDVQLSYAELNRRANQIAHYLRSVGVGPEVVVGVLMERRAEMVIGLLGILKAGGAYLPLDPAYPNERLAFMLQDASVEILLTQRDLLAILGEEVSVAVCLDSDWEEIARHNDSDPRSAVMPDNIAYMIYTSGSTGRPKGVMIQHHSAVVFLNWSTDVFTRYQLDGVLASTSICFDLSVFELFAPLSCGGKVMLIDNILQLPSLAFSESVSLINTVPSAVAELIRMNGVPSSVRTINLAGEPLKQILAQDVYRLPNVDQLWNLYGPSEDTTYSTFSLVAKAANRPPSIGRPISNSEVYLLDPGMELAAIGTQAELFIGGQGLARGYLGRGD